MTKLELQCQGSRQLSPYGIERQFYKLIDLPVELLELIFAKIAPSDFCSGQGYNNCKPLVLNPFSAL